ncbi:MAG: hypothetical protein ACMUEM_04335 [Flavobacteriales bacterium AspAUS03]
MGVFGFECVGIGLYHILHEIKSIRSEIKKIYIKHPEKTLTDRSKFLQYKARPIAR